MDFADSVKQLATQTRKRFSNIQTEEATKNAIIMPFLGMLGYNVFDPLEVIPEFTADVGTKKGEKIDYAIIKNSEPAILVECKWCGSDLNGDHASQLYRYFSATPARIGILTNGIIFEFYSDLDKENLMDQKPFFVFNLLKHNDAHIKELNKFAKPAFDTERVLSAASELKYAGEISRIISDLTLEPDDDFVRFFAGRVYTGRLTKRVVDGFHKIVKKSFSQCISDKVSERLQAALDEEKAVAESKEAEEPISDVPDNGIETTQEEMDAYNIIRAIVSEVADPSMAYLRDTKSYCGVLFDDNNRKPICRLRFNSDEKKIGLFDKEKNETTIPIKRTSDIFRYRAEIQDKVNQYLAEKP